MSHAPTDPIALITGGSRGIGRATALTLAARGIDVVITYVRAEREAHETVAAIRAAGRRAEALQLDVSDTQAFVSFVAELRRILTRSWSRDTFDYLVHNAGVGGYATFGDTSEALFDELLGVHLRGPFFLTQKLLPLLADGGRIVSVSSGLARYVYPGFAAYSAMKAALEALSRTLAVELGPRRISVNVVAPGGIVTDFGGGGMRDAALQDAVRAETPLGRVGLPEDIAGVVAMLLSHDAAWLTGQRLEATGGYRL